MTIINQIEVFGRTWSFSDEHAASSYGNPVIVDDAGRAYGPVDPVAEGGTFVRYADEVAYYALEDAAKSARQVAGLWTDDDAFDLPRKAKEWAPAEVVALYTKFIAQNPNHPFRK